MTDSSAQTKKWSLVIAVLLLSIGMGIAVFVYRSTTQIREALAEEILEQQHDVATLMHEYSNVMVSLERSRLNPTQESKQTIESALRSAQEQLVVMRSNYSFARLEGAAEAHAYIKPILEDIGDWTRHGVAGYSNTNPLVLQIAANRMGERYDVIREIAVGTELVAEELISEQTDFLENFRDWLLLLLAGFAMLSLTIAALLIRQRNLQAQLAIDQEFTATRLIDAETRGRHQAEVALLGSEQFLRATLNSLPSDIAILDQQGIISAVNAPWKKFASSNDSKYKEGGIGYHYEQVFRSTAMNEVERKGIDAATKQVVEVLSNKRDSMFFEYPCHRKDKRQWSVVSMSTFNTGDGRHAVLVHEDVSERKQLEERDRRLRAELAHVSRLTTAGELASGLAHELNQPLTAITHNCDAVMSSVKSDSQFDAEMLETVQDISEQAQRAGGIIRSMRHLVRKDTTDMAPTDINKLVKDTVRLTAPEAREKGVQVMLDLDDSLPQPLIDPVQIQQVLVNLERNGVEAMWQANSPTKELTIETCFSGADRLQVAIKDTGPGVEPSFADNLFSAFQTTKADGMGLGLSISRNIVEDHGGRLWIDSDTEGVTIFKFTIPFKQG